MSEPRPPSAPDASSAPSSPWPSPRLRALGVPLLFAAAAVLFTWRSVVEVPLGTPAQPGPGGWPLIICAVLLASSLSLMRSGSREATPSDDDAASEAASWRGPAVLLGACAFAALAFQPLGYRLTTLAVVLFLLRIVERRGIVVSAAVAFVMSFGSYALLAGLLRVRLPTGVLGF